MASDFIDSYVGLLAIEDDHAVDLGEDDDSGGGLDAELQAVLTLNDIYLILATTYEADDLGTYRLSLSRGPERDSDMSSTVDATDPSADESQAATVDPRPVNRVSVGQDLPTALPEAEQVATATSEVRIDSHRMTLHVPSTWEQIPDSLVQQALEELMNTTDVGGSIAYVDGFQPAEGKNWFDTPYVLFEVIETGPVTEQDYVDGVTKNSARIMEDILARIGGELLSFERPRWDPATRLLWIQFLTRIGGGEQQQAITGHRLFRNGVLMAHYYFPASVSAESVRQEVEQILMASHFDPGMEYVERNLSTTMGHSTGLIKEQFPVWRGVWWED